MRKVQKMGVINITPDSFSDGNLANSISSFRKKFLDIISWADIVDIGAESTAPMNSSIDSSEELKRYRDVFFPFLSKNPDPKVCISIDTYKVDVFKIVAREIHKFWPESSIIFNDISGIVDAELLDLFKEYEIPFTYILSHNLVTERSESSHHMNFCSDYEGIYFIQHINDFFIQNLKLLEPFSDRVLIDPCFGFSKTRDQNQYLLNHFSDFVKLFPSSKIVFGISKKSFLRFPIELNIKEERNLATLEHMHSIFIAKNLFLNKEHDFVLRVHDDSVVDAAIHALKILEI